MAPIHQIKIGKIQVAVWEHQVKGAKGDYIAQSFNIVKPYQKDGKWANGTSFDFGDICSIVIALIRLYLWKYEKDIPTVADSQSTNTTDTSDAPF
jgi:hypothetical protein